jgi:catechol 2,3-dioxygenase-like lactoylglutathione lyase family enzyme
VFDGVDVVTLPAAGIDDLLALYTEGFGFTVVADRPVGDPAWGGGWGGAGTPTK